MRSVVPGLDRYCGGVLDLPRGGAVLLESLAIRRHRPPRHNDPRAHLFCVGGETGANVLRARRGGSGAETGARRTFSGEQNGANSCPSVRSLERALRKEPERCRFPPLKRYVL